MCCAPKGRTEHTGRFSKQERDHIRADCGKIRESLHRREQNSGSDLFAPEGPTQFGSRLPIPASHVCFSSFCTYPKNHQEDKILGGEGHSDCPLLAKEVLVHGVAKTQQNRSLETALHTRSHPPGGGGASCIEPTFSDGLASERDLLVWKGLSEK